MVSSIHTLLERVFIHLHAMTGDQRFLLHHSPSPFFLLFLLSLNYFQLSQKQAHTNIHTNALLQVHTNKTYTSADVFPPVHSVHPQPQLLPPRVTEGAQKHPHPQVTTFSLPLPEQTAPSSLVFVCHFLIPYSPHQ